MQFVCLLLVLLSATVLSQDANISARYKKFINQHINGKMSVKRCDDVIRSRKITKTNSNECKETNTFIRATTKLVKSVCKRAVEQYGNMRKSLKPFDIVVCKLLNKGARRTHCRYRGQAFTRRIVIKCEKDLPVHFEGDIIYLDD